MCALIARTARPVTLVATVIRKEKKLSVKEVKINPETERERHAPKTMVRNNGRSLFTSTIFEFGEEEEDFQRVVG